MYAQPKNELKEILSKNVEFSQLEKLLTDASKPGGKTELSGKDLGIPKLEKRKYNSMIFRPKNFRSLRQKLLPDTVRSLWKNYENAGSFIMIKRLFVILVSSLWLAIPLSAQSNKLIRELEGKRGALQKQIAETESILQNTKKDVGSQLNGLAALTGQIEERKRYILAINNDVETIERELVSLNRQLNSLEKDLKEQKEEVRSICPVPL